MSQVVIENPIINSPFEAAALKLAACTPAPIQRAKFNPRAVIPFGLTIAHIETAMNEFIDFLGFINGQLNGRKLSRFETMLMPANFSSMVGEFIITAIPKHCTTLVRNEYHNG